MARQRTQQTTTTPKTTSTAGRPLSRLTDAVGRFGAVWAPVLLLGAIGAAHHVRRGWDRWSLAFAGWMAATYIVTDSHRFLVSGLTFIMAVLVAQTRVESGVHSALEVAYGGALGALVTLSVFQLL